MFFLEDGLYRAEPLTGFAWLEHGFGSRHSDGWAPPEATVHLKQIHSPDVIVAAAETGCLGEGDGLVTNRPGAKLAIRTADCIPVLLVDVEKRVVAAVHAGWRGTAAGIVSQALLRMAEEFGSHPEHIHAAIGPGIGVCCYEVGAEVEAQLAPYGGMERIAGRRMANLPHANAFQLATAGVPGSQVYVASLCTHCRPEEFFSYRRSRDVGRMVSAIAIRRRQP